jgi:hypothetical protein
MYLDGSIVAELAPHPLLSHRNIRAALSSELAAPAHRRIDDEMPGNVTVRQPTERNPA